MGKCFLSNAAGLRATYDMSMGNDCYW